MGQDEWGELVCLCTTQYVHRKTLKHTENFFFFFFNFCLKKKVLLEEEDSLKKKDLKKAEKCNNRLVKEVLTATSKCV